MKAKIVSLCVFLLCIPAICVVGVLFFKERSVSFACTGIVIAMLAAYFYVYEKKSSAAWELVIVALMSALSVVGRIVFFGVAEKARKRGPNDGQKCIHCQNHASAQCGTLPLMP